MKISIIIVNWNTRDLLVQCLRSIYDDVATTQGIALEVIVVDNGSTDDSAQAVRQSFSQVQVIENQENVGFARANNQAIATCRGQFILLLNPDTELMPGALLQLVQFMEENPQAGGVGARILNPDLTLQASCSPFPTLSRELWYLLHLDLIWPYAEYPMASWEGGGARSVDVLLGACLLLRRSALDQIGLLDEVFFMYSEEVDLCYRLHQSGWHLYWVPEAEVVHHGGQSTSQMAPEMFMQLYRSKVLYFRKHYGTRGAQLYKLILFLTAIPRVLLPLPQQLMPTVRRRYRKVGGNYRRLIEALPSL